MAGSQGGRAEAAQTSADDLAREIETALAKGDLTATRSLVPRFLQTPGLTADNLLRIGVNLAQYDLYSEASEVFRPALTINPKCLRAFTISRSLSWPFSSLGMRLRRGKSPSRFTTAYLRGKIEVSLQEDAEAERDLSAAFAAAPQEENCGLDLGLCYIRQGKYQLAVEVFQKALGFHKNSPFLRLGLALAQFLGGLNAESVETCRTLLASQPDFSPARVMMAFALYMQGKTDEATAVSAQGLHDPSPFPYLYYLHAVSLLKLQSKDYDTLVNDLTLASRSIPNCSLCYLALSKVYRRKSNLGTATADLEKAVELDPTLAEGWYNLAMVYDQAGRHADAQSARRRFETLKESKANRETEMLRGAFLKTLSGERSPQKGP
jgi:tetratricopeptide (TPR) repeat protein